MPKAKKSSKVKPMSSKAMKKTRGGANVAVTATMSKVPVIRAPRAALVD